jgi:hypothetical protein
MRAGIGGKKTLSSRADKIQDIKVKKHMDNGAVILTKLVK